MSLFGRLFSKGKEEVAPTKAPEQAVIIRFENSAPDWTPFFNWEPALRDAVERSGAGEYDGHELALNFSDGFAFLYGSDAERLFRYCRTYFSRGSDL